MVPGIASVPSVKLYSRSALRLALIYFLIFSVSVLAVFSFVYWATTNFSQDQTDATIEAEIEGLSERYERDGLQGLRDQIADRLNKRQPGDSSIYLLTDQLFRPIVGNLDRWPRVQKNQQGWIDFQLGEAPDKTRLRPARARPFLIRGKYHLLVGRDVYELNRIRQVLLKTLIYGVLVMLALALFGGLFMGRSTMRRINAINRTSEAIMKGNLSQRIPTRGSNDDFDDLAGNLNAMLDRIEELMIGVRRVSDNIAHDLKTPLARIRNRLEVLKQSVQSSPNQSELVEQVLADADGLLSTFNALLRIARIESAQRKEAFSVIDFSVLVNDVAEFYEPLTEDKGQSLSIKTDPGISILGDRDLLFQAIANLVDNAIKYTPPNGEVRLSLIADSSPTLTICDDGVGIPIAEREKVWQRFYRADSSRTTPGSGLGLALVDAVARLHNIEMSLGDNKPGLCVQLQLPAQA